MIDAACPPTNRAGEWDAIVIGAGPAGALAAFLLAQRGERTVLVEKQSFPRYKVCGGCLNSRALQILNDVGLGHLCGFARGQQVDRLRLMTAGQSAVIELPPGRSVSRQRFDAALVAQAIEAGVEFRDGTQARVLPANQLCGLRYVELENETQQTSILAAKVVLAADGLGHPSLRQLDLFQTCVSSDSYVGLGTSVDARRWSIEPNTITMALGRHGYVGSVLVEDETVNVAAAISAKALRQFGPEQLVAAVFSDAGVSGDLTCENKWIGTRPLTCRSSRLGDERLFLVGDSIGYVEPFTGEGMAWALASAQAVVPLAQQACENWQPELIRSWTRLQARSVRDQRICRVVSQFLRYPFLTKSALSALSRYPGFATPFVGSINHCR